MYIEHPYFYEGKYYANIDGEMIEITKEVAYMSKRKLTKEMADAFVDSIIIHGKYDYEIKLVYDDQFADLQKLKKEKEAQSR